MRNEQQLLPSRWTPGRYFVYGTVQRELFTENSSFGKGITHHFYSGQNIMQIEIVLVSYLTINKTGNKMLTVISSMDMTFNTSMEEITC